MEVAVGLSVAVGLGVAVLVAVAVLVGVSEGSGEDVMVGKSVGSEVAAEADISVVNR